MKLRKRIVATLLVALMIFSNVSTLVSADDDLSSLPVEPQVVTEEPVPDLSTALPAVERSELPAENQTPDPAQDEPAPEVTDPAEDPAAPDGETSGDPQDEPAEVPEAPQGEDEPAENGGGFAMPGLFELPGIGVPEDVPETEIVRPESETEEDLNAENGIMPMQLGADQDRGAYTFGDDNTEVHVYVGQNFTLKHDGTALVANFEWRAADTSLVSVRFDKEGYKNGKVYYGYFHADAAGDTTVTLYWGPDRDRKSKTYNIHIHKVPLEVKIKGSTDTKAYNGQEQILNSPVASTDVTVLDGEFGPSEVLKNLKDLYGNRDVPVTATPKEQVKGTDPDTYTADWGINDFNYTFDSNTYEIKTVTVDPQPSLTITSSALTVKVSGKEQKETYNGKEPSANVFDEIKATTSDGTEVTVELKQDAPADLFTVSGKDVGTYPTKITSAQILPYLVYEDKNFTLSESDISITQGKLIIQPASLTVSYEYKGGSNTKMYDGTPLTVTGKIDGLQNGETASVVFDQPASRTDAGTSKVTPSIAWGNTNANNYTVEGLVEQTLTVNKRPITVNLKTTEELYVGEDGSNVPVELVEQPAGLVRGHEVTLNKGATGTVDTSEAGKPTIGYTAGVTITDADRNDVTKNYDVEYAGTAEVKPVYTITVDVTGGTANTADTFTVHAGADQTITFKAEPDKALESATMDGTPIELTKKDEGGTYSYTVKGDGNHNIKVVFSLDSDGDGTPDNTETNEITVTVTNGTANPTGPITVAYGQNQTITFTANSGNALDSVTMDGQPAELKDGQYTFENVTKPHSIAVVYAADNDGDGTPDYREDNRITVTVTNGTANPAESSIKVAYGADQTIAFTPADSDYILASVTVDGEANKLTNNTFTFTNVTDSHSIIVVYVLDKDDNDTPDEDEATVTYKVVNGTWSDKTTEDKTEPVVFGHWDDASGNWVKEDSATLHQIPSGMQANTGYNGGAWSPRAPETVSKNDDIREFTYTFAQNLGDTVPTSYTVEYYKDSVLAESYTKESTDWAGNAEHKIAIQEEIDQTPYKYTGYKLGSTDPETIPDVGEQIVSGTTIKLYYVKDTEQKKTLRYTIHYYKDDAWAEDETVTGEVWVNDPDTLPMKADVAGKYAEDNYMLESSLPETLPADVENDAAISLYYTKDVNGDGKPDKFQAFIEYTAEANGTILNADTLVKVVDFDAGVSQREVTIEATAEAEDGYALDYWDLDGTPLYDGEYLWNELTVEPGHTYTFTAHFDVDKIGVWDGGPDGTPDKYQITINYAADPVEGGYVEPGNEVVTVSAYQDQRPGEKGHAGVYATAHPYDHYLFDHWTFTDDGPRTIMLMLDGEENPDDEADPLSKAELSYEFDVLGGHSYTLTAHFTRDEDDDGVADKYQATVTYRVVNGTWSDGTTADKTETVTLLDEDGKPAESGSETLKGQSGMIANAGYTGGSWDTVPGSVTAANDGDVYTYTFTAIPPAPTTPDEPAPAAPAPVVPADDGDDDGGDDAIIDENDTPLGGNPNNGYDLNANGGNGTGSEAGGVTIEDDDTPLAGGPLEEDCCILHLLIMLVALAVAVYYTHCRKQEQARRFEMRSRM